MALKLNLNGAYIPSFNKSFNHLNFSVQKKFVIIGSAHNLKEIRVKELQKVDAIFLSSIFKKNNNYLGLLKFINLSSLSNPECLKEYESLKKNLPSNIIPAFDGLSFKF